MTIMIAHKFRHIFYRMTSFATRLAHPGITLTLPSYSTGFCKFLRSQGEIDEAIAFLRRYGYVPHVCEPKNWDLAHIIPAITQGNVLDMGSRGSYLLRNMVLKHIRGELYGVDYRKSYTWGVKFISGNLVDTKLPDNFFQAITCLSVIEHEVDIVKLAHEAARLLQKDGRFFITFDYAEPKIVPEKKLFGLEWWPLDRAALLQLIHECEKNGLYLTQPMDWTTGDAVIRDGYYSPEAKMSYTFGMVVFEKR